MAHKKAGGSTKNGRDSKSKRLGVKKFGGQVVKAGNIIIRQRGSKYFSGINTDIGKDYTIFASCDGVVYFTEKKMKKFNAQVHRDILVNVRENASV